MEAIRSLARSCGYDDPRSRPVGFDESLWQRVTTLRASPAEIGRAWAAALDLDLGRAWPDPRCRGVFLACLAAGVELASESDANALADAIGSIRSKSGARLNVGRTRCEIFGRAAEALFKEARRRPSDESNNKMLGVAEALFCVVLADCSRWVNASFVRGWRGMRGTARLLLANARSSAGGVVHAGDWEEVADDLQAAFDSGNRGSSAATYLLDGLLHWLESLRGDADDAAIQRIEVLLPQLSADELGSRAVQTLAGRYRFVRSFKEADPLHQLATATQHLDRALALPAVLAHEDHFVLQVRGQVKVRLSLALEPDNPAEAARQLDEAIDDLMRAAHLQPTAYKVHASLPSALLSRSDRRVNAGDFAGAQADLDLFAVGPLVDSPEDLRAQAATRRIQLRIRQALTDENAVALEGALTDLHSAEKLSFVSWGLVALATKRLFHSRGAPDSPSLLQRTVDALAANLPGEDSGTDACQQHHSHLAVLTLRLLEDWRGDLWPVALQRFHDALKLHPEGSEPLELLGKAAECKLLVARMRVLEDDLDVAQELLEDASELFVGIAARAGEASATNGAFRFDVAFSKAGEAFHRLAGLSGSETDIRAAIHWFEQARANGNDSHQLCGLLGDAWYRLFRATRDKAALSAAIDLKAAARQQGAASRENYSVSGRMLFLRWQLGGEQADLIESVHAVGQAAALDPLWPWPPFQLHDQLLRLAADERSTVLAKSSDASANGLIQIASEAGLAGLAEHGSRLVIQNEEFRRRSLGGRKSRDVYVLDDPHGLLGQSYVFKHTDRQNAERDVAATHSFSAYLREKGLARLRIPEAVTIVPEPDGSRVVHVMRLAKGYQLGQAAIRATRLGLEPDSAPLEKALIHLAGYHAWGYRAEPVRQVGVRRFLVDEASKRLAGRFDRMPIDAENLFRSIGATAGVRKKDAHPENWLIDQDGNLVMIDFESKAPQPLLYDVALLLDDYPFLRVDAIGWQFRVALCNRYLDELARLDPDIPMPRRASVESLYGALLSIRTGIGLAKSLRPGEQDRSSSATRATKARIRHYEAVLDFLRVDHPEPGVRALAESVRQA